MSCFDHIVLLMTLLVMSVTASSFWTTQKAQSRTLGTGRPTCGRAIFREIRAGSTTFLEDDDEDEDGEETEDEIDPEKERERLALQKWRMDQQMLMQLRSVILSEELAKRGFPITTLMDVATKEGDKPPESVDWDCAMSTEEEPKPCLYSFDAGPGAKVVAPIETDQWITLSTLNRLRRTEPARVEPMWHDQYSILKSWFGDDSEFSLLQHVGFKGFLIEILMERLVLRSLLLLCISTLVIVFMPVIEFLTNRFLVSSMFWSQWPNWRRVVHANLPLKLLIGQMTWKAIARAFGKVETKVRDFVVDAECDMLEECTPLTVGPGSEVVLEESTEDFDEGWGEEVAVTSDMEEETDEETAEEEDINVTASFEDAEEEYDSEDW